MTDKTKELIEALREMSGKDNFVLYFGARGTSLLNDAAASLEAQSPAVGGGDLKLYPPFGEGGIGSVLLSAAEDYIAEYVMGTDEGADHEPTEFERYLLVDAINGLFSDEAFWGALKTLIAAAQQSTSTHLRGASSAGLGEIGPRPATYVCKGCPAYQTEAWREPSGDGETDDTGQYAWCNAADHKSMGAYHYDHSRTPEWCPASKGA